MSELESELSTDENVESESSFDDNENNFNFESVFRPYEDEPLATGNDLDAAEQQTNEVDEDGLTANTLRQRFEKVIPLQNWCACGSCHDDHLVLCAEFRCCKEMASCLGRFTFEGLDADCILKHPDYQAMTNKTVLLQIGPFFTDKEGRRYRKQGRTENEFIRAVAYRWLIRWLCGYMGWENTRPLPACIYHDIRCRYATITASKGYHSGQERATNNS